MESRLRINMRGLNFRTLHFFTFNSHYSPFTSIRRAQLQHNIFLLEFPIGFQSETNRKCVWRPKAHRRLTEASRYPCRSKRGVLNTFPPQLAKTARRMSYLCAVIQKSNSKMMQSMPRKPHPAILVEIPDSILGRFAEKSIFVGE